MAKETKHDDFLLDDTGDDLVEGGDLSVGDGREDDGVIIVKLNSGALKSDPILGPNLVLMMKGKVTKSDLKQIIALHLRRDEKEPKKVDVVDGNFKVEL